MATTSPEPASVTASRSAPLAPPPHVMRIHMHTKRPANANELSPQHQRSTIDGGTSTASTAITTATSSTMTETKARRAEGGERPRSHSDERERERATRAEAGVQVRETPAQARVLSVETVQRQLVLGDAGVPQTRTLTLSRQQQQQQPQTQTHAWDPISSHTASDKSWRSETLKSYHTPNALKTRIIAVAGLYATYGQPLHGRVVPARAATFPPLLIGCIKAHQSRTRRWAPASVGTNGDAATDNYLPNEGRVREANERYNRHYDRADPRHKNQNQLLNPTTHAPVDTESNGSESDPDYFSAEANGILKRRRRQKRHTVTFLSQSNENNNGAGAHHHQHLTSTNNDTANPRSASVPITNSKPFGPVIHPAPIALVNRKSTVHVRCIYAPPVLAVRLCLLTWLWSFDARLRTFARVRLVVSEDVVHTGMAAVAGRRAFARLWSARWRRQWMSSTVNIWRPAEVESCHIEERNWSWAVFAYRALESEWPRTLADTWMDTRRSWVLVASVLLGTLLSHSLSSSSSSLLRAIPCVTVCILLVLPIGEVQSIQHTTSNPTCVVHSTVQYMCSELDLKSCLGGRNVYQTSRERENTRSHDYSNRIRELLFIADTLTHTDAALWQQPSVVMAAFTSHCARHAAFFVHTMLVRLQWSPLALYQWRRTLCILNTSCYLLFHLYTMNSYYFSCLYCV